MCYETPQCYAVIAIGIYFVSETIKTATKYIWHINVYIF